MARFTFEFRNIDGFFFSNGQPFNQDDVALAEAESEHIPSPHILMSAVRNLIAEELLEGAGDWATATTGAGTAVSEIVGVGLWDTGDIRLELPRLRVGNRDLVPAPMHLLAEPDDGAAPSASFKSVASKPEEVDFSSSGPTSPSQLLTRDARQDQRYKTATSAYLNLEDWSPQSRFGLATTDVHLARSWALSTHDRRIGIALDREAKSAIDGQLYALALSVPNFEPDHCWPDETHAFVADVLVDHVEAASACRSLATGGPCVIDLGGRGRVAEVRVSQVADADRPTAWPTGAKRLLVASISPAVIGPGQSPPMPGGIFPGATGAKVIAATFDRPRRFGPWDRTVKARDWNWELPAGAVWVVEVKDCAAFVEGDLQVTGANMQDTPDATNSFRSGFGQVIACSAEGEKS